MNPLITCMSTRIFTYARRLTQPLIALIVLTEPGCTPLPVRTTPTATIVLAVATWNLDAGRGDLARFVSDLERGRLTHGQAQDVVLLLQEYVLERAAHLDGPGTARRWTVAFEPVRTGGGLTSGNAIVSSRPLTDTRAIPLPRERQPRNAIAGRVDVAGEPFFVASAHLENRTGVWRALFSDLARRRQAEALIDALPAVGFGVLGGDFNAWLGRHEPAWQVLLDRFDDTPGVMRTPTFRDRLVLDHLLFDLPPGWHAVASVAQDGYGSDHHPVVAAVSASTHGARR